MTKPCPFCGSTKIELVQFDEDGDYAAMFCRKKNCGASGPTVDADHDDLDEYDEETTYPKALKAWNSRVNHAAAFAELVEEATGGELYVEKEHDLWCAIYRGHGLSKRLVADCLRDGDARLIVYLVNHASAFAELVEAGKGSPIWPLPELLDELANSADHLLDDHNCDSHGYEQVRIRAKEARRAASKLRAALRRVEG